ncbi:hypothetical protein KAH27_06725 [bacterium]|nr:hypothetical protein [bacterium]
MKKIIICLFCFSLIGNCYAEQSFNDIINAPTQFLDKAETFLSKIIGLRAMSNEVVDIAVVGSFAQGCARLEGNDPSDLDIVIFVKKKGFCGIPMLYRFGKPMAKALDFPLKIELYLQYTNMMEKTNPDWIAYSLLNRKLYGRHNGKPRLVKQIRCNDKWYAIDRSKYSVVEKYRKVYKKIPKPEIQNSNIVFIAPDTKKVLLKIPLQNK